MAAFEKELNFFISHQDELVVKYAGKVLVIQGENVIGVFDSPLEAYTETQKEHELGSFMIQPCEPGPEAFTVSITPSFCCH